MLDGAMGTYYAQKTGDTGACELANISAPDVVRALHLEYLSAGSRLLRANTFAADTRSLGLPREQVRELILRAVDIAREAAQDAAVTALSLGPMSGFADEEADAALDERLWMLEQCIAAGIDAYWFETYADAEPLMACARFLRQRMPLAGIGATFSCSADGYTRAGQPIAGVLDTLSRSGLADVVGFNCGLGPAHAVALLRAMPIASLAVPLAVLPNAGYPTEVEGRMRFSTAPNYFADTLARAATLGAKLLGGCCGTTPQHIRALSGALEKPLPDAPAEPIIRPRKNPVKAAQRDTLADKLAAGRFVTLAELDPPKHADLSNFLDAAYRLQVGGIDALTIPDAPLAQARMSSGLCAAQVHQRLGMDVIPHLCCRDRNINALHGDLLGMHAAGLRAVLAVTGDAIPESDHGFARPVFNLHGTSLAGHIARMNGDLFSADPLCIGVAFNPTAANPEAELKRLAQKKAQGAAFCMTQPIFDMAALPVLDAARALGIKVLAGILPLVSYRNVQFMHNEVPGIRIPEAVLARFSPAQDRAQGEATGIAIAAEAAALTRAHADGFYLMVPFSRAEMICTLLTRLRAQGVL